MTPRATVGGCEFAGVVDTVGDDVTAFAAGDRVFGYCEGRHAEYLAVSALGHVARIPEGLT